MFDLLLKAELHRYGIDITVMALHAVRGVVGEWEPRSRTIRVDRDLTPAEHRCTVMHELAHAVLGHQPTGDPFADAAIEREADEWAAERLIPEGLLGYAQHIGRDEREVMEILKVDQRTYDARVRAAEGTMAIPAQASPLRVVSG